MFQEAIATGLQFVAKDHSSRNDTWLVHTKTGLWILSGETIEHHESGGLTLRAAASSARTLSRGATGLLGHTVADSHAAPLANYDDSLEAGEPPWVFQIGEPGLRYLHLASAASQRLVKEIQESDALLAQLGSLLYAWSTSCAVHNDLKWDNIIVYPAPGHSNIAKVKIIDWEMAGIGDPCWDVGTVLSEFVAFWALSIPVVGGEPYEGLAKYPIEDMQPAIRAFWESYAETMEFDRATARERLVKSVRFAGARLIQTAYERTQTMTHLTPHIYLLLQLSLNIMKGPEDAAESLFGIPLPDMTGA